MKTVLYHASSSLHLFDHAAPFSYMLKVPLIFTESTLIEPLQKYYPFVDFKFISPKEINYATLAQEYDFFIQPVFWRENLFQYFGSILEKPLLFGYLSHGESDKGHFDSSVMSGLSLQEVAFFGGKQSKDRLQKQGHWDKISCPIFMGNVRFAFYKKYRKFYDDLVEQEIFSKLNPKNPTLFYAPTWNDIEKKTSFFSLTKTLVKQLPKNWNLIVKPHPLLEEREPVLYYQTLLEESRNDQFLVVKEFPLIYPLINRCTAYLGDFSSVGYDALYLKKPLFFYDPYKIPGSHPSKALQNCGFCITKKELKNPFSFIEKNSKDYPTDLREKGETRALYTFGKEKTLSQIRKHIEKKLEKAFLKVGV